MFVVDVNHIGSTELFPKVVGCAELVSIPTYAPCPQQARRAGGRAACAGPECRICSSMVVAVEWSS